MADELWQTAGALAEVIKEAPQVRSFRRVFDLREDGDDLPQRLSQVTAVYQGFREHPLLIGWRLNHIPDVRGLCAQDRDRAWLEDAINVGSGYQLVIEYLRSELPGYPDLLLPHLQPGTPYAFPPGDQVFVNYFPWDSEIQEMTVQLGKKPPDLTNLGGVETGEAQMTALAEALRRQPTWQRFETAQHTLEVEDRVALEELCRSFADRMREEVVDGSAGARSMARFEYRMAVLEQLVTSSPERPRAYMEAFEAVHDLITVVSGLMETLITSEGLLPLTPYRMDVGAGDDLRPASLGARPGNAFQACGQVIYIEGIGPTSDCIVYPRSVAHNFDLGTGDGGSIRITGLLGIL